MVDDPDLAESLSTPNAINMGFSFAAFVNILSITKTGSPRSAKLQTFPNA
jgi:hypothetical protein